MSINIASKFLDIIFKNHSRVFPKQCSLTHNYFLKICPPPGTKALKLCQWRNEKYECSHIPKLKSYVFHKLSKTINRKTASYYVGVKCNKILDLDIRLKYVVIIMFVLIYWQWKKSWFPLNRKLCGPWSYCGCYGRETRNPCYCQNLKCTFPIWSHSLYWPNYPMSDLRFSWGKDQDCCLLACNAVLFARLILTFQWNLLYLPSG
jgi:hypothetical protein